MILYIYLPKRIKQLQSIYFKSEEASVKTLIDYFKINQIECKDELTLIWTKSTSVWKSSKNSKEVASWYILSNDWSNR